MEKALLLYSKMQVDSRFAGAVAETCKLPFLAVTALGAFQDQLSSHEVPLIFAEVTSPAECAELAKIFGGKVDRRRVHLIISQDNLKGFGSGGALNIAGSVIVRKDGDVERAGRHYARVCRAALEKQTSNFEQFFEKETPVQIVNIPRKLDRGIAANALVNYLEKIGVNPRIASLIAGAVNELLIQATPMADTIEKGSFFNQFKAGDPVLTDAGFQLQLRIGADQRYIGISIRRPHGGVRPSEAIHGFISSGAGSPSTPGSGDEAGKSPSPTDFALSVVYRSGGSIVITSDAKESEILLFYEAWEKIRDFKQQFQFVSVWDEPGAAV